MYQKRCSNFVQKIQPSKNFNRFNKPQKLQQNISRKLSNKRVWAKKGNQNSHDENIIQSNIEKGAEQLEELNDQIWEGQDKLVLARKTIYKYSRSLYDLGVELNQQYNIQLFTVVTAAAVFGIGIQIFKGGQAAQEYFAAYVIEQSLSIDNLFVFVIIFRYFKVPYDNQNDVLNYGIIGAAVLRGVFILAGVGIIEQFHPVLLIFAAILIYQSYKIISAKAGDADEDLSDNKVIQVFKKYFSFTNQYHGDKFFIQLEETGKWVGTPLLLALLTAEVSDIIFAVDSIPAVFGVTLDPVVVYSSNMFAILSLRSMFGFVSYILERLEYIDKAVGLVLGFIGVKLILEYQGIEVSTAFSLEVIIGILLCGGIFSYIKAGQEVQEMREQGIEPPEDQEAKERESLKKQSQQQGLKKQKSFQS